MALLGTKTKLPKIKVTGKQEKNYLQRKGSTNARFKKSCIV
jgi:hypothetical protein